MCVGGRGEGRGCVCVLEGEVRGGVVCVLEGEVRGGVGGRGEGRGWREE